VDGFDFPTFTKPPSYQYRYTGLDGTEFLGLFSTISKDQVTFKTDGDAIVDLWVFAE
jgi:hypothetical protein